ncbi:hypothetical protein, unlikely [Trypanosoma brucei brucei TREU927]|uniref:Uncharacterized protein n=1 Tax=Trypanosoma brucei brucei (strain 927/4 GUTat10.1) TaxID=185431 RepID=Q38DV6_TRYB2|nr:hypothetical protein, unlikely [Trypanosoma brucei brucei TREU927]EAN77014.1 hypothetical protein, unlikely [Trypanosoma brucei brucei TREU927]
MYISFKTIRSGIQRLYPIIFSLSLPSCAWVYLINIIIIIIIIVCLFVLFSTLSLFFSPLSSPSCSFPFSLHFHPHFFFTSLNLLLPLYLLKRCRLLHHPEYLIFFFQTFLMACSYG